MSTSHTPPRGLTKAECRHDRRNRDIAGDAKCVMALAGVVILMFGLGQAHAADFLSAGPLYDQFYLTLVPGQRTEAVSPFFYKQETETQKIWAVPPLISYTTDTAVGLKELDILYPILTYDRYGESYRWQFFQLLSVAGGPIPGEEKRERFTIFPLYFQQRSSNTNENYTAVFPFYGHLKHRLFREEIYFVMFPIYGQSIKHGIITDNYLYPIFHLRHGDGLEGWQFWPLFGNEHKDVTTVTNNFGDQVLVQGHDSMFVLWPIFYNDYKGYGTTNISWQQGVLPLYSFERSPLRDSTTVIWPFFSKIEDREKKYKEWDFPWPLWEIARGEGKTTTRFFPIYSKAHTATLQDDFYMWPIYKYSRAQKAPLDRKRVRIVFFLYSGIVEKNTETQKVSTRSYLFPLYLKKKDFNGNTRLQIFAPLEPFVPGSHKIERDYSPLWSVWRQEFNPSTSASSQSLLWNTYRREASPDHKKVSLLFGLFQYQSGPEGKRVRLFYIPLGGHSAGAKAREKKKNDG